MFFGPKYLGQGDFSGWLDAMMIRFSMMLKVMVIFAAACWIEGYETRNPLLHSAMETKGDGQPVFPLAKYCYLFWMVNGENDQRKSIWAMKKTLVV